MNRENKRKQYEKGYYKTHPCTDSFTCKVCGRPVVAAGAGSDHRNHCPNCLSSLHLDIEPGEFLVVMSTVRVRLSENAATGIWLSP